LKTLSLRLTSPRLPAPILEQRADSFTLFAALPAGNPTLREQKKSGGHAYAKMAAGFIYNFESVTSRFL
jgi:hypothetical protein